MNQGSEPPNSADLESVRAWFGAWGATVAAVDFVTARTLFADDVSGFGTYKDFVRGLDALEGGQWRAIWPTISDFAFTLPSVEARVSPDRLMAVGATLWTSTGYDADGQPYDRPGRATAVLSRTDVDAPWLGCHTHFSVFPAERQMSFGQSGEG
ncbi:MAG: nuclear transport factor 2 family protein [Pseudomonadota bacterium]